MNYKLIKIYPYVFSAFCGVIPFSQFGEAIPNIAIIPVVLLFPFIFKKDEIKVNLDKPFLFFLLIITIILLETIIFTRWGDFKFITKILIVPLVYILSIPIKNKKLPLFGFFIGATLLMLISYFRILNYVVINEGFDFSVGKFINEILLGDRPYVGFVYVLGSLLSIYFYIHLSNSKLKFLFLITLVFFVILILLISARLSMISLFSVALISFFYTTKWKIPFSILLVLTVSIIFLIKFNPNFIDRFYSGFKQDKYTFEKMMIMEPRYHIWDCALEIAKEENVFWKGIGYQNSIDYLVDCFKSHDNFRSEEHRQYFIDSRFNSHNQFIGIYLSSGIFALLLFTFFFILNFVKTRKNYFAFALLMSLFLFCIVENLLSRQMGCLLFAFVWLASNYFITETKESSKKIINASNSHK